MRYNDKSAKASQMEDRENKDQDTSEETINNYVKTPTRTIPKIYKHPLLLFSLTVFLIFISETIVMVTLSKMTDCHIYQEALLDSLLLTFILFPLLFFLVLKPFRAYIAELEAMEVKLNEDVITDDLTGLLNRRGLFTIGEKQCELANRNDFDLNFVFMDLDGMKAINDKYGHVEGDKALVDIADILKDSFRSSDIIGRIGGDEFTVIVAVVSEFNYSLVTKRLYDNLNIHNAQTDKPYKLSVSLGVTQYSHKKPCSIDELYSIADRLMYEQKRKKNV